MKKLITGAIVAAALAVPVTPAFAIHDPNVPAGNGLGVEDEISCSNPNAQAVGIPSNTAGKVSQHRDLSHSNTVLSEKNNANPPCHFR